MLLAGIELKMCSFVQCVKLGKGRKGGLYEVAKFTGCGKIFWTMLEAGVRRATSSLLNFFFLFLPWMFRCVIELERTTTFLPRSGS